MLNVKKTFALAIIALFIGLIAYSTAASITSSTNGTNFTFNLSGQPAMDNFSTIVCGVNMTCSQNSTPDNHTIYINSLGAGGGSGTVTQINQGTGIILVPNPITTTGTAYLNGVSCNPANQASVLNSSGGLECVSNIDTGIGAEVDPFSVHWNVFANAVHNNESEPSFNANYSNLVNVTNNSYVLRNGTLSRANITIDQPVNFMGYDIINSTLASNSTDYNLYVNTTGNDSNPCTIQLPCLTIQGAWLKIQPIIRSNVTVLISNGTYSSSFSLGGKVSNAAYFVKFIGASNTTELNSIMTGGTQGNTQAQATVKNSSAAWTNNIYMGKWIKFTSGSNNGKMRVIEKNNGTTLTLTGASLPAIPANADTFKIISNNVNLSGTANIINPTTVELIFEDLNIGDISYNNAALVRLTHTSQILSGYLNNKVSGSTVWMKETSTNISKDISGYWIYGSTVTADRILTYYTGGGTPILTWAFLLQGSGHILITNGATIKGQTTGTTYGLWAGIGGTAQADQTDNYGVEANTAVFFINNTRAIFAEQGGAVESDSTTPDAVFMGNTNNKVPAGAVDPAWIDS